MPLYSFNIIASNQTRLGAICIELENDEAAWEEATMTCSELMKGFSAGFRPGDEWRLEVLDASQQPLYSVRISSAGLR